MKTGAFWPSKVNIWSCNQQFWWDWTIQKWRLNYYLVVRSRIGDTLWIPLVLKHVHHFYIVTCFILLYLVWFASMMQQKQWYLGCGSKLKALQNPRLTGAEWMLMMLYPNPNHSEAFQILTLEEPGRQELLHWGFASMPSTLPSS